MTIGMIIGVFFTGFAVIWCGFQILTLIRSQRLWQIEQKRPRVSICFELDQIQGLIYAVVRNTGFTMAENVEIKFNPAYKSRLLADQGKPNSLDSIKLKTITPGQEVRYIVDASSMSYKGQDTIKDDVYDISITYYSGSTIHQESYGIDLLYVSLFDSVAQGIQAKFYRETKEELQAIKDGIERAHESFTEQSKHNSTSIVFSLENELKQVRERLINIDHLASDLDSKNDKLYSLLESIGVLLKEIYET